MATPPQSPPAEDDVERESIESPARLPTVASPGAAEAPRQGFLHSYQQHLWITGLTPYRDSVGSGGSGGH
jgi:hypothetical protein